MPSFTEGRGTKAATSEQVAKKKVLGKVTWVLEGQNKTKLEWMLQKCKMKFHMFNGNMREDILYSELLNPGET